MANFAKRKKTESATDNLPLQVSTNLKNRYRKVQNEFDKAGLASLHVWTRESLAQLLDEAERFLSEQQSA
jgi:hypothetical protein